VAGVGGNVGSGCQMTSGASGVASGGMFGGTRGGVGGKGSGARGGHRQFAVRPSAGGGDGLAGAVVLGMSPLEVREPAFNAASRPQCQSAVGGLGESLNVIFSHGAGTTGGFKPSGAACLAAGLAATSGHATLRV
jgi:hypothetical protein